MLPELGVENGLHSSDSPGETKPIVAAALGRMGGLRRLLLRIRRRMFAHDEDQLARHYSRFLAHLTESAALMCSIAAFR